MKENKNLEFKSTITNTFLKTVSAYRRSDTASIEADQAELKELVSQGSNLYFEELPCGRADLAFKELNSKLMEKIGYNGCIGRYFAYPWVVYER